MHITTVMLSRCHAHPNTNKSKDHSVFVCCWFQTIHHTADLCINCTMFSSLFDVPSHILDVFELNCILINRRRHSCLPTQVIKAILKQQIHNNRNARYTRSHQTDRPEYNPVKSNSNQILFSSLPILILFHPIYFSIQLLTLTFVAFYCLFVHAELQLQFENQKAKSQQTIYKKWAFLFSMKLVLLHLGLVLTNFISFLLFCPNTFYSVWFSLI